MTGPTPTSSLIAAQVYGAAGAQQRQSQQEAKAARQETKAQQPRFEVKDQVTLRGASAQLAANNPTRAAETQPTPNPPAQKRESGVGQREAINPDKPVYKRPGSLVDVRA
jgi:hypothetical protein